MAARRKEIRGGGTVAAGDTLALARAAASLDILSGGRGRRTVHIGHQAAVQHQRLVHRLRCGVPAGPVEVWVEQLAELALTDGVSSFVLMVDRDGEEDLRRFAEEVAPAVRELVAQERAQEPASPEPRAVSSVDYGRLGVTPKPDDGTRLLETTLWDESARPTGPAAEPDTVYTERGRLTGRHLIEVHDHLRDVGAARSEINEMTVRQNNWTLGAFCESYRRFATVHHSLEDASFFPQLRRADPRLGPVLDRLSEERRLIHEVLDRGRRGAGGHGE